MYRQFFIAIGFGFLLLVASWLGWTRSVAGLFWGGVAPAMGAETTVARHSVSLFSFFAGLSTLTKENSQLRKTNVDLESQIANLKEVQNENDLLRKELGFAESSSGQYLPAQLIGRTATGTIKDLIINQGSKDGIILNQSVVAQGFLIGRINAVSDHQATVMVLSHPRSLVAVLVQSSRATGLLQGGISGLVVDDLLVDADVKAGDMIVTSGLGGNFPAGLPIGQVIQVTSRKGDVTKKATVRSPLDLAKLELVFVRKGGQ